MIALSHEESESVRLSALKSRDFLSALYRAAVASVDPERLITEALGRRGDAVFVRSLAAMNREFVFLPDRVRVLALGKAAAGMARAAAQALGPRIEEGLVICPGENLRAAAAGDSETLRTGNEESVPDGFRLIEASYPFPDERSVGAGEAALAMARGMGSHDLLLVLLSGGGSSLMTAPVPGVDLSDKSAAVSLLMAAGAPISDINIVRSALSRLKGGGLASAARGGNIVTLVLSDVADGSWHLVASGPTLGIAPAKEEARAVLQRYRLTPLVAPSIRNYLFDGSAPHAPMSPLGNRWSVLLGDIGTALEGARAEALRLGADVRLIPELLSGEARSAARRLSVAGACAGNLVRRGNGPHRRLVTLFGGETTMKFAPRGRGGRNRTLALATALQIAGVDGAAVLVAGTDGLDNGAEAAGAYVDDTTVMRARDLGLDARRALEENETALFFEKLGDAFCPGPTGTNVGDVAFVLAPGGDEEPSRPDDDEWVIPLPNVS